MGFGLQNCTLICQTSYYEPTLLKLKLMIPTSNTADLNQHPFTEHLQYTGSAHKPCVSFMIPTRIPGTRALELGFEHVHFHFTKPITHKDQANIQTLRVASANQPPPSSLNTPLSFFCG